MRCSGSCDVQVHQGRRRMEGMGSLDGLQKASAFLGLDRLWTCAWSERALDKL